MTDFYDDSIINFDSNVAALVDYLKSLGIYQETIIGVYTDHGTEWTNTKRLPLILHFPENQGTGKILGNTQNMDIPPTILDYLGIEDTDMDGWKIVVVPASQERIIFSTDSIEPIEISGLWTMPNFTNRLPFRQMESIKAIQCQKITSIDLGNLKVEEGSVQGHTSPCSPKLLNSRSEILSQIGKLLHRAGYQLPDNWEDL